MVLLERLVWWQCCWWEAGRKQCPSPECAAALASAAGWKQTPEKERAVVTAALWRRWSRTQQSLSVKAGTRGHELHAGRLRLFSLIQGRKSLMSPDKSAKLDASVQWRYTTWHKEISFIFSYQPNVMIWERGEERSPEQLGWDYTFSMELITVITRSSVYQPSSHAHLGDYHFPISFLIKEDCCPSPPHPKPLAYECLSAQGVYEALNRKLLFILCVIKSWKHDGIITISTTHVAHQ